ncbi:hypothetical protein ATKI12_6399 [Kitasatospora sp. Ki12]
MRCTGSPADRETVGPRRARGRPAVLVRPRRRRPAHPRPARIRPPLPGRGARTPEVEDLPLGRPRDPCSVRTCSVSGR